MDNQDGVVILPDSGERKEFESGAVRDIQAGKGRCDLLPLDVVGAIVKAPELALIEEFKDTKDVNNLYLAIKQFAATTKVDVYTLMLEVSKHFESGAVKYGENNWKKGMGLRYYLSSAVRHFLKFKRADTDEPHDRAFVWNLLCAAWTYIHMPELDDVNIDMAPETLPATDVHDFMAKIISFDTPPNVLEGITFNELKDLYDESFKKETWQPPSSLPPNQD